VETDPLDKCPDKTGTTGLCPGADCDGDDAWPLDMNVDKVITLGGDVSKYIGRMGASGGPPPDPNWWQRLDLNMDNSITVIPDIYLYRGNVNIGCN
jgi:hypothetical protein